MTFGMILNRLMATIAVLAMALCVSNAYAHPEYAEKTRQGCKKCHETEEGGDLTDTGLEFSASGYTWPPEGGFKVISRTGRTLRFLIGFVHILAGVMWFGAILYVHIVLRPAYAAKGLPKTEVFIGLVSMTLVGVTGYILLASKINSWAVLSESPWGQVLSLKIALYLLMISLALFAVTFIGPKLHAAPLTPVKPKDGVFDSETLKHFNGQKEGPSYIAYKGNVYDVSRLPLWKKGAHFKHRAGEDLTAALEQAPHGKEKLELPRLVGQYNADMKPQKTGTQKLFYVIAYTNLGLVVVTLFVIAYWRWGI